MRFRDVLHDEPPGQGWEAEAQVQGAGARRRCEAQGLSAALRAPRPFGIFQGRKTVQRHTRKEQDAEGTRVLAGPLRRKTARAGHRAV